MVEHNCIFFVFLVFFLMSAYAYRVLIISKVNLSWNLYLHIAILAHHFICLLCTRRNVKWRSPQAAVIPNFHLPMRSFEVKNR